jgi:predicted oxidoreductase
VIKRAGDGCNLAPQDGTKGAKHPYPAIKFTVPQVIRNVIQRLREMLRPQLAVLLRVHRVSGVFQHGSRVVGIGGGVCR